MSSSSSHFFLLLALTVLTYSEANVGKDILFKDCGSTGAKIKTVSVTPCSNYPCTVTKGKNSTIIIDFISNAVADNLTIKADAFISGVEFPYPLPQPNACKDSGLVCPLKAGKEYEYHLSLDVPSIAPSGLTLEVELEMMSAGKDYVCLKIAVTVA